jgi:hypothetical protein
MSFRSIRDPHLIHRFPERTPCPGPAAVVSLRCLIPMSSNGGGFLRHQLFPPSSAGGFIAMTASGVYAFVSRPVGAVWAALDPLLLKPGGEGSCPRRSRVWRRTAKDDRRRWRAPERTSRRTARERDSRSSEPETQLVRPTDRRARIESRRRHYGRPEMRGRRPGQLTAPPQQPQPLRHISSPRRTFHAAAAGTGRPRRPALR